jgi:hypothetical protein
MRASHRQERARPDERNLRPGAPVGNCRLMPLGVTLLLAMCRSEPQPAPQSESSMEVETRPESVMLPPVQSENRTERTQDSLRLTVTVPKRVRPGERVPIVLQIANISGRELELYLQGRDITADVTVRNAERAVVWRKLEGVSVPAILSLRTLPAGESLTVREEWDQRISGGRQAGAGRFQIEAALLTEHGASLVFPPASVEITR